MGRDAVLASVDRAIDRAFDLKGPPGRYKSIPTSEKLSKLSDLNVDTRQLIEHMLYEVQTTWHGKKARSKKNWVLKKNNIPSKGNSSHEVILERWIGVTTADSWGNQVPVASGVFDRELPRFSIDLVHEKEPGEYEFIELKLKEESGPPLSAAMEVLKYGIVYIFSRNNAKALGYAATEGILHAKHITLKVLAPADYYKPYDLKWLENRLQKGLDDYLMENKSLFKMKFCFESLVLQPTGLPAAWKESTSSK